MVIELKTTLCENMCTIKGLGGSNGVDFCTSLYLVKNPSRMIGKALGRPHRPDHTILSVDGS